MPKIVDHDERRREIVQAYLSLVADVGFEAATTRALTNVLGVSTGSLWTYFGSQANLVQAAFRQSFTAQNGRLEHIAATSCGMEALVAFIREVLPLTEEGQREARVSIEFWLKGTQFQEHLNLVQDASEGYWNTLAKRFLQQSLDDGDIRAGLVAVDLADALIVLLDGLQVEFMIQSRLGTIEQMKRVCLTVLRSWATDQGATRLEQLRATALPAAG